MSTTGGVVAANGGGGGASAPTGAGLVDDATAPGMGDPVTSTDAPRVIIDLEGHTVVLTAFDLLLMSTGALLAADLLLTAAEVFA
jgi:hypothetical protein